MYSLNITDAAEEDILSTLRYIADVLKTPIAANNLLDEIERYEEILENTPGIYPFVPDEHLAQKGFREPLINLTLISGSLLFFSFSCGKLRKINNNVALIYSRLNKSVLP